ncbi:MAG: hypothetical protein ACI959_001693 [Limisphaerales bacterium]|jgi:hypothetical protein
MQRTNENARPLTLRGDKMQLIAYLIGIIGLNLIIYNMFW